LRQDDLPSGALAAVDPKKIKAREIGQHQQRNFGRIAASGEVSAISDLVIS
jgi:hypothetical protein